MLQDLDSLAARIGQMAQLTRQLQAERQAMQSRLAHVEQERNALREQLVRQEAQQAVVAQEVATCTGQLNALRQQAEASEAKLHAEIDQYRASHEVAQQALQRKHTEAERMRTAALSAQERIDAILMRLPGASQE